MMPEYRDDWIDSEDLAIFLSTMIPTRPRFLFFGPDYYTWEKVEPWVSVGFSMGTLVGNIKKDSMTELEAASMKARREAGRMGWYEDIINRNPTSFRYAFPEEFDPQGRLLSYDFQSGGSRSESVQLIASIVSIGIDFGRIGLNRAVEMAARWVIPMHLDFETPIASPSLDDDPFWYPAPSFESLSRFISGFLNEEE